MCRILCYNFFQPFLRNQQKPQGLLFLLQSVDNFLHCSPPFSVADHLLASYHNFVIFVLMTRIAV